MRILLIPLSIIYLIYLNIKNFLFISGILKSTQFNIPVICIGNLSFGGSGKTPHTDFIVNFLKKKYKVAILSRGYKRKSSGFIEVNINDSFRRVGDEPLLLKRKHTNSLVIVCENRKFAITKIIQEHKDIDVIILDDGLQHRKIQAGLNILLTPYHNLYFNDYLFPFGSLRDRKNESKRADNIIITKSPNLISLLKKKEITKKAMFHKEDECFFSEIKYEKCIHLFNSSKPKIPEEVLLVTGIADTHSLIEYLVSSNTRFTHITFKDHHDYNEKDIRKIIQHFEINQTTKRLILTTEKDAVKLLEFESLLKDLPIYYLPINIKFQEEVKFKKLISEYVRKNKRNS